MVRVRLTWPDEVESPGELAEFDISVEDAMSIFLDRKVVMARPGRQTPTPRLKRAIAEAQAITEGRFDNADDLFDALSAKR